MERTLFTTLDYFGKLSVGSADAALSLGGIDVLAPALLSCALVFPLDVNHLTIVFIQLLVWVPVFQFEAAGLGTHTLCSGSFFFHSVQGLPGVLCEAFVA